MGATSNNIYSLNTGDHRCLMEILYAKHKSTKPTMKNLIDFLGTASVDILLNFNQQAIGGSQGLISPWTPIVESKVLTGFFFIFNGNWEITT